MPGAYVWVVVGEYNRLPWAVPAGDPAHPQLTPDTAYIVSNFRSATSYMLFDTDLLVEGRPIATPRVKCAKPYKGDRLTSRT